MTGEERVRLEAAELTKEQALDMDTLKKEFGMLCESIRKFELKYLQNPSRGSLEALRCLEKAQERVEEGCMWAVKGVTTPDR